MWYFYLIGGLLAVLLLVLLLSLYCFCRVFYSPRRRVLAPDEYELPAGKIYEPFREDIFRWMRAARHERPYEEWRIRSHDGLTLVGRYYPCDGGGPLEILFHGYQGNAERDMSGGIERCFALGRSALIVNQRASGPSDGHVISFGINERHDCVAWAREAVRRLGSEQKIILTGISMGAATVMLAAGEQLPESVVCILADCGYTSAREIISKIVREMHLPPALVYPFIRIGARVYGRLRLDETSPIEAVKRARVPLILIHGDEDTFVPCEMSERLYAATSAPHRRLVIIKGAGHGLCFPVDKAGYLAALADFQKECGF